MHVIGHQAPGEDLNFAFGFQCRKRAQISTKVGGLGKRGLSIMSTLYHVVGIPRDDNTCLP